MHQQTLSHNQTLQRGFTLVECIAVILLMAVFATVAGPALGGLLQLGRDKAAVGRAEAINQAQQVYKLRVAGASSTWTAASSSAARYGLIESYLPFATPTLMAYQPSGYTFNLANSLDTPVQVVGPSGALAY